jgi:Na+-transporting NADH:ubiquinone oxidoreductase subunit NqrC
LLVPAVVMVAPSAYAAQYFTVEQVQKALFADATEFRPSDIQLSDAQVAAIHKASDSQVRSPKLNLWEARKGDTKLGYIVVDEVYGKHEFITYAVALTPDGAVRGIEVMSYNESYGSEIRDAAWRAQFNGKKASDSLKINTDIKNIGGATLSCVHITEGVRRVLASYDLAIKGTI